MASELEDFSLGRDRVFKELGKFNVYFEQTTHSFKSCIATILKRNGLQDEGYIDCLTGRLTAGLTVDIFQYTSNYYLSDSIEKKNVNLFVKTFNEVIKIRNLLIHASWIIGLTNRYSEKDEPYILGIKPRVSKDKLGIYNLEFRIDELIALNDKIEQFNEAVHRLSQAFEKGSTIMFDMDINFKSEIKKMRAHWGGIKASNPN